MRRNLYQLVGILGETCITSEYKYFWNKLRHFLNQYVPMIIFHAKNMQSLAWFISKHRICTENWIFSLFYGTYTYTVFAWKYKNHLIKYYVIQISWNGLIRGRCQIISNTLSHQIGCIIIPTSLTSSMIKNPLRRLGQVPIRRSALPIKHFRCAQKICHISTALY